MIGLTQSFVDSKVTSKRETKEHNVKLFRTMGICRLIIDGLPLR